MTTDNLSIGQATEALIKGLGFNSNSANFKDTPERVIRMWKRFINYGHGEQPDMTTFPSDYKNWVELTNHITWGFCPHHLLPVKYTIDVKYKPNGFVLGASKLGRACDYLLRDLPLQEDLTISIVNYLMNNIPNCDGAACSIHGYHLCYVMRGLKSREAVFKTYHQQEVKHEG
jgi:GTP cyclohydrolase I